MFSMTDTPAISIDEFKSRLHAAGFNPDDKSLKEMYAALPYLDAMRTRVRRDTAEGYREMLERLSGIETPTAADLVRLARARNSRTRIGFPRATPRPRSPR